jgi:hypothetical protein
MVTLVTSLDLCRVKTTSLRLPVESLDVPAGHVEQAEEPEAMTFITASLFLIYKSPLLGYPSINLTCTQHKTLAPACTRTQKYVYNHALQVIMMEFVFSQMYIPVELQ